MSVTPEETAAQLLEVVPIIIREIRSEIRSQRSTELSVPQFRALTFVARNVGSSLLEVANYMGLTPPSACRLIDGLIARGMVTREEHPIDRRRVRLTVTHRGQRIMETSRESTMAYLANKLKKVGVDEREIIVKAMKTLQPVFAKNTDPIGGTN
jgi:DNA-binding MarR family transcriptional regulator